MAYNNFPMNYPQYGAYPTPMSIPTPPAAAQGGIIWVQGEAGAKSYMVAPNNTVQLWDSEAQTIYLKSADASGMPTMKILDYKIREVGTNPTPALMQSEYVTRDELSAFEEKIRKMIREEEDNGKSDF